MLNSHLGVFLYFMLPNHLMWRLLATDEKAALLESTRLHNNAQYANPGSYDRDHMRFIPAGETKEGRIVSWAIGSYSPSSVLEIGPGNGFYARLFLDSPNLINYTAIDIVKPFIEYIAKEVIRADDRVKSELICGDFLRTEFKRKFDMIVFINSIHHIPNRTEFMQKCVSHLSENGCILLIEPRHGISRITQLCLKYIKYYSRKKFWADRNNFSSHHFLTFSEIRHIAKKCRLRVSHLFFYSIIKGDRQLANIFKPKIGFFSCRHFVPLSLFAQFVYAVFEKDRRYCLDQ